MRLKEALAQANGWQRIWMVIAALWILVVLTAGYRAWPQSVWTVTDFSISPEALSLEPQSTTSTSRHRRTLDEVREAREAREAELRRAPRTLTEMDRMLAADLRNQRAMFAGKVLMVSVIPPAFLYFLGWWGTSQVRRRHLNGWQRICAVIAGAWTLLWAVFAFATVAVALIAEPEESMAFSLWELFQFALASLFLFLLFTLVPAALLYALGYFGFHAVVWIRRGFQDNTD